jgi:hypothetical protein
MTIIDPFVGVFVFLGVMLINRILAEKALKPLTAEEKARLLDSFSGYRIYSMVIVVVLAIGFFVASKAAADIRPTVTWGIFGFVVVWFIGTLVFSYAKMKRLNVARGYVNNFLLRSGLQFIALVFLVFAFLMRYFPSR